MIDMREYTLIDLTHPVDREMPTWEDECGFKEFIDVDYKDGVRLMRYEMFAGVGTHMDAPAHVCKHAKNIADILPENLFAHACVVDVSYKTENKPDYQVSVEDIEQWEQDYGQILPGSLCLAYTGWSRFWPNIKKYRNEDSAGKMHFPSFSHKVADILLERGAVGAGIDTLSPDGADMSLPFHKKILGDGKYLLENVANLDRMPPCGAAVIVAPLRIVKGSEAPVRMFGLVKREN